MGRGEGSEASCYLLSSWSSDDWIAGVGGRCSNEVEERLPSLKATVIVRLVLIRTLNSM